MLSGKSIFPLENYNHKCYKCFPEINVSSLFGFATFCEHPSQPLQWSVNQDYKDIHIPMTIFLNPIEVQLYLSQLVVSIN